MKSTFKFAAAAASATLLAGASAASATVLVATWTGTVSNGYDYTGVFGSVGSLDGDTFVVKYTYDTSVGILLNELPYYEELHGGDVYGPVASPVSATITINGHAATSNGDDQGLVSTSPGNYVYNGVGQYDTTVSGVIANDIYNGSYGVDQPTIDASVPLTDVASYAGEGYAHITTSNNSRYTRDAYADLKNETVQIGIGSASAIPEPAAWALMLSGLGVIGAGIRGRRRAAALA